MRAHVLLLLLVAAAAADDDDVGAAAGGGVPFSLTLTLEEDVGAEAGEGAGAAEDLAALARALNRTLAVARAQLQVRVVARDVEGARGGGARRMHVEVRGRLPPSPPAPLAAEARGWLDDVDTSPEALANLFIELAATLVGLSWGVYSMWLAG